MARTLKVRTDPAYEVRVGPGVLRELPGLVEPYAGHALLADQRVLELHGQRLGTLGQSPTHALQPGEEQKRLAVLEEVLGFLAEAGLGRDGVLIAFGGGVIGDLAGLAASLYKRGIACIHVPTTLLAQVDSSVGGKTAVNLTAGKNLVGTFHQPAAVLADTEVLSTLAQAEWQSGLGEVVKAAMVGDPELFAFLEQHAARIRAMEPSVFEELIARAILVKEAVVSTDPREQGERKSLNLGHTFAHGIEHAAGYGRIPHGVAVAVGCALATKLALHLSLLKDTTLLPRLEVLLVNLGLPRSLAELRGFWGQALTPQSIQAGMAQDKKGPVGRPRFVLPERLGQVAWDVEVDPGLALAMLG